MMLTILLGILSSVAAEVVTAINKKLQGTTLQGNGAFLLVFGIAFIGAAIKTTIAPDFTWDALLDIEKLSTTFSEIFVISQLYFMFVMKKLNLDVQPTAPAKEPLRFEGAG